MVGVGCQFVLRFCFCKQVLRLCSCGNNYSRLALDILSIKVSILLTAMPAASTSAMLAEKYGRDYKFASELIMTSTILSLFTIPVVATALEWIF